MGGATWKRCGLALAVLGLGLLSGCAKPAPKELHIYNWSDYIDPQILKDFTAKTGIKVTYDTFDSAEVEETKVLTGNTGYDIVTPSNNNLVRYIAAKAVQPIDASKLPNHKNLWPELLARMEPFDPGGKYDVPYMWGTVGLGYNVAALKQRLPGVAIDSWKIAFDPANLAKLKDCGVYFLDAPEDMFAAVLQYLGKDPNSRDPKDYAEAEALFAKLRPYVKKFHSSENINALANGDICLAIGYSGDMLQAKSRAAEAKHGVELGYVIPKEGTQVWFDTFAIPADAPHPEAAYAFLDYMLQPEVIARASNFTQYPNANAAATPLVNAEIRNNPNAYPPAELFKKLYVITSKDQALLRDVNRQWTRILTGK